MSWIDVIDRKRVDGVTIYTVDEYDFTKFDEIGLTEKRKGNRGGKKHRYKEIVLSFDIETTNIKKLQNAVMYVWQFGVGTSECIIGRTWGEFKRLIEKLCSCLNTEERFVIFCHNLYYEFSFLKSKHIYEFMPEDCFILYGRKIAKCVMYDKIEFRCSYLQTNMSLALFTAKYGAKHCKLSGSDFDYSKQRYPWSILTDEEISYCVHDVIGLNEAMIQRMKEFDDDLYSLPLTSTGYVRREMKAAIREEYTIKFIHAITPPFECLLLLEENFRGGNTHANRYHSTHIVDDVMSFDRVSSYPDVMMNCLHPVGRWWKHDSPSGFWFKYLTHEQKYFTVAVCALYKFHLKDITWGCPYISRHKCRVIENGVFDNGRVLSADYIEIVLNDIDLRILEYEADFTIKCNEIWCCKYRPLPEPIRNTVKQYYKDKTELKGVEGSEVLYEKSKNLLCSCYGLFAQSNTKQSIDFLQDEEEQFRMRSDDKQEIYNKYLSRAFASYAWGVSITAWARYRLFEGLKIAHETYENSFVYCDTDSVKCLYDERVIKAFEEYNKERIADSKESGAYAKDKHGKTHYMGVYEFENVSDRFKTLGAKKYASETDGKLKITIAGVNKKQGAEELKKRGGLEALKEGFIFKEAAGLKATYNDRADCVVKYRGHDLHITDNVYLEETAYTVGLSDDYALLLNRLEEIEI